MALGTRYASSSSGFLCLEGRMTALVTDIVSATGQLETAILNATIASPDIWIGSKSMKTKAKLLPHVLVQQYPELSEIECELRGLFETCSKAIDRNSINPVVAKAAISLAHEYQAVIEGLRR
ncbi:hypothetical protein ACIQUB_28520 [Rhizobium sp. NPDC090275]|uniref:hypothetical protein n=2 Tax=Rhizobium TaxID=379 RepID=UPI00383BA487